MNPVVWAGMQSTEVIQTVDLLLPDLVDEDDLGILRSMGKSRQYLMEQNPGFWDQPWMGPLSAAAAVIFLIPDPIVYGVGSMIGGPVGGAAAVVIVNAVVVALIVIDYFV